jgi:hypothetical protein
MKIFRDSYRVEVLRLPPTFKRPGGPHQVSIPRNIYSLIWLSSIIEAFVKSESTSKLTDLSPLLFLTVLYAVGTQSSLMRSIRVGAEGIMPASIATGFMFRRILVQILENDEGNGKHKNFFLVSLLEFGCSKQPDVDALKEDCLTRVCG